MINPEDSDDSGGGMSGGAIGATVGATTRPTIRLLHGPAIVVVKKKVFTTESIEEVISLGDPIYLNEEGLVTTIKPDESAPILGVVVGVEGVNTKIDIKPGTVIDYNGVTRHSGGVITESDTSRISGVIGCGYNEEEDKSEELKTAKDVALERKGGMRKGGVTRTTMEEDFLSVLLED